MAESAAPAHLVSVVIVNFNGADLLRPCLHSVLAQPYRPIEIIVVENGSTDNSRAMLAAEFPAVKVIALERNAGFAEGNNIGVRAAQGEFIVLLNNDTVVERDWLPPLIALLGNANITIAASKVMTEGIPPEFYSMNGTINFLGYNIMRHFRDCSRIFYAGGTSMMFRKKLIGEPFLNEYFLYHEDVYASWRRRLRGEDIRMAEASVVQHVGNATTKRASSARITFYRERNRLMNLLLFYETHTMLKLIPYLFFDVLARLMLAAITSSASFAGTLRALVWLATHRQWIREHRRREQSARTTNDATILAMMSCEVFDPSRTPGVLHLFNTLSRWYAMLVRLPFHTPERTQ